MSTKDAAVLAEALETHARAMLAFGYHDVTADMMRQHHEAWMRGETLPDVIFRFSEGVFKDYPQLFGRRP